MKSFDRWFADSAPASEDTRPEVADDLPEGLTLSLDGKYMAQCRKCGNHYEWWVEPELFDYYSDANSCGSFYCTP